MVAGLPRPCPFDTVPVRITDDLSLENIPPRKLFVFLYPPGTNLNWIFSLWTYRLHSSTNSDVNLLEWRLVGSAYSADTVLSLLTTAKVKALCTWSVCFFLVPPLKFSHLPFVPVGQQCMHPQSAVWYSDLTPAPTPHCSRLSRRDSRTAHGIPDFPTARLSTALCYCKYVCTSSARSVVPH